MVKLLSRKNYEDRAWESDRSSFGRDWLAGNGMEAMIWKEQELIGGFGIGGVDLLAFIILVC